MQVRVAEKTNEIPVARALRPARPLAGRVVTAAALHTCARTARAILAHDADSLLVVKATQPTLSAEGAAYFSDPTARVCRIVTADRRRGRTQTRTLCTLYVTARLSAHLRRYSRLPRISQVACLLTTVDDRRGTHRDVRFLLTSLTPPQADPARVLTLARGHWSIESRHWVRDVPFDEDRSPFAPARRLNSSLPCATWPIPSSAALGRPLLPPPAAPSPTIPRGLLPSYSPRPENSQTLETPYQPCH